MNKILENLEYIPIFRSRQQELLVLKEFDFGKKIFPLLEIIKEKDRINNTKNSIQIYLDVIGEIKSDKVFIDLPTYLKETTSTQKEVLRFLRGTIDYVDKRIEFFKSLNPKKEKIIPVLSSLFLRTGEIGHNDLTQQYIALKDDFDLFAFRIYLQSFDNDLKELQSIYDPEEHIIIYDIDQTDLTSPLIRKQMNEIKSFKPRVLVRSAINEDIQNNKLETGKVVTEANNSLVELYKQLKFNVFGDYAGIKKDVLSSGGTISPGFLFYDPYDNFFYGFKGERKLLSEFETTIVPGVLNSESFKKLLEEYPVFIENNHGIKILKSIDDVDSQESGQSQSKFKKIAMLHYLHCIKTSLDNNISIPLSNLSSID